MTQNRIAEPVHVRVAIIGTQWVHATATASAGVYWPQVTPYIYLPILMPTPRIQVGAPILTVEGR